MADPREVARRGQRRGPLKSGGRRPPAGYPAPLPCFSVFRRRSPVEGGILYAVPSLWTPCLRGAKILRISYSPSRSLCPMACPDLREPPIATCGGSPYTGECVRGGCIEVKRTLHGWKVCVNIIQGGRLAQVVERWFHEPEVRGSSPLSPTSQYGCTCMMARVPHMSPLGDEAIISSEECMLQRSKFAAVGRQHHHSCGMQEHGCGA